MFSSNNAWIKRFFLGCTNDYCPYFMPLHRNIKIQEEAPYIIPMFFYQFYPKHKDSTQQNGDKMQWWWGCQLYDIQQGMQLTSKSNKRHRNLSFLFLLKSLRNINRIIFDYISSTHLTFFSLKLNLMGFQSKREFFNFNQIKKLQSIVLCLW